MRIRTPFSRFVIQMFSINVELLMVDVLQEMKRQPVKSLQEIQVNKQSDSSVWGSSPASTAITNRVCEGEMMSHDANRYSSHHSESMNVAATRDPRPSSAASSVASSVPRNPFGPDDYEDVRSTHSEIENMYAAHSSAAAAPHAYHTMQVHHRSHNPYFKYPSPSYHPMAINRYAYDPFGYPIPQYAPPNMYYHRPVLPMTPHPGSHVHSEFDCRCCYRTPEVSNPDSRYQYFQRMQQPHQQHKQRNAPTEFGMSFDFDVDSEMRYFPPNQTQNTTSPEPDSRCLSPNNPFSPVFAPIHEDGLIQPPARPPARVLESHHRGQPIEFEGPPPPLPKRKAPAQFHAYHNTSQREIAMDHRYACPPVGYGMTADSESPPPPLPLPSRKKSASSTRPVVTDRRVSFETPTAKSAVDDPNDPFNVAHIEKTLSQISLNRKESGSHVTSSLEKHRGAQTSTPLTSTLVSDENNDSKYTAFNVSSIKHDDSDHVTQLDAVSNNSNSVFDSSSHSSGFDSGGCKRIADASRAKESYERESQNNNNNSISNNKRPEMELTSGGVKAGPFHHFGEDHISPPERNIFQKKDPFADDDFFSSSS